MPDKRRERSINTGAILLIVIVALACIGGVLMFMQDVRIENVCSELVNSMDYHVINGKAYCINHETVELIDSGLTFKY